MEFIQAHLEMKLLKETAKDFLKWTLRLVTFDIDLELDYTKMSLFLNILDQKPWIDSVLNGACDSVWPEEVKKRSDSNSRLNLSILIKALIGLKSFGVVL